MSWFLNDEFEKFKDCMIVSQKEDAIINLYLQNKNVKTLSISPIIYDFFNFLKKKRQNLNLSKKGIVQSFNITLNYITEFLKKTVVKNFQKDILKIYERIVFISSYVDQYLKFILSISDIEQFHKDIEKRIYVMRNSESHYSIREHFIAEICYFFSYGLTMKIDDNQNLIINDEPLSQTSSIYNSKNWKNVAHIYRLVFGNLNQSPLFYQYQKIIRYQIKMLDLDDQIFAQKMKLWINEDVRNPLDFIKMSQSYDVDDFDFEVEKLTLESEKIVLSEQDIKNVFDTIPLALLQNDNSIENLVRSFNIFGIALGESFLYEFLNNKN